MKAWIPAALFAVLAVPALAQTEAETAATPDGTSVLLSAEAARADLAALYRGLQSAHYDLYANRSRQDYDALYAQTQAQLDAPLNRLALYRALQTFAAYGKVAHARIDFPAETYRAYREGGGTALPIYLRIVDGQAYVGEDYSGNEDIGLGDAIIAMDGVPMAQWLERTARYVSADTPYIAHSLLESTFPMYLWLETGERAHYTLRLRKADGRERDVRVDSLARDALIAAVDQAPAVFALDAGSREFRMLTDDVAYLRPGPFYNVEHPEQPWDNSAFIAFVDQSFATLLAQEASSLVIDLRNNPGGDNSFSDHLIAWFADRPFRFYSQFLVRSSDEAAASNQARLDASPGDENSVSSRYAKAFAKTPRGERFAFDIPLSQPREQGRFTGTVYVLVNRNSYSNAVNVAAIVQDYGWGRIAGEMTADFATTYGAMEQFTLPASGFVVGFPKALIVRPSGDTTPGGVVPDLPIETPIVPGAEDVVLQRLLTQIGG